MSDIPHTPEPEPEEELEDDSTEWPDPADDPETEPSHTDVA